MKKRKTEKLEAEVVFGDSDKIGGTDLRRKL